MDKLYTWLFSEEERKPVAYIVAFFVTILVSTVVSLFIVAVDRHVQGWVQYIFN
tara:strand:+ start:1106 stop:1267 length:162 start_codon:yes stop_codon:yes gene_type:complete